MATMKSITARGTRLEQLKQLAKVLATGIDAWTAGPYPS